MALPEVALPRSSVRVMRHDDADYRVTVAWPEEPAPAGDHPVVYLLDADTAFGTLVESIRLRSRRPDATGVPPALVVGVSLDGGMRGDRERRTFDFTPRDVAPPAGEFTAGDAPRTGGADRFLSFIVDHVQPAIEREFPVDARRRMLFGHSLGGFFALHALFTQPAVFRTVIAASPSIWWDAPGVMRRADRHVRSPDISRTPRVMLTAGEFEQAMAPWQPVSLFTDAVRERRLRRRMVEHVVELGRRLAPAGEVETAIFPGADHASVVTLTVSHCLRFGLKA